MDAIRLWVMGCGDVGPIESNRRGYVSLNVWRQSVSRYIGIIQRNGKLARCGFNQWIERRLLDPALNARPVCGGYSDPGGKVIQRNSGSFPVSSNKFSKISHLAPP
jgi:glycine/D-amino acid oxidase-like deaminating enzyme